MMQKVLAGVALPVLLAGGVFVVSKRHSAPLKGGVALFVGLDDSGSYRLKLPGGGTLLGRSLAGLAETGASLSPRTDSLVLFRVNRQTQEFYAGKAPDDEDAFTWSLIARTQNAPTQDKTFPAPFWSAVAKRSAPIQKPFAIAFWTDGDNDDKASRAQIRAAARVLAARKNLVSVEIFGATPKNWEQLRDDLAPLGDRLHLYAPESVQTDELLERLENARPEIAHAR